MSLTVFVISRSAPLIGIAQDDVLLSESVSVWSKLYKDAVLVIVVAPVPELTCTSSFNVL